MCSRWVVQAAEQRPYTERGGWACVARSRSDARPARSSGENRRWDLAARSVRATARTPSPCASPAASKPQMRIGKWPCLAVTFALCVLLLQRCGRVEPSPDVLLKRRYEELHARTLAAAAGQHGSKCPPWQRASSPPALLRARAWCLLEAWHSLASLGLGSTSSRLTLQAANAWPDPEARAALARGLRRGDRGQLEPAYFGSDGPLQCAAFLTASRQHGNSTAACAPGKSLTLTLTLTLAQTLILTLILTLTPTLTLTLTRLRGPDRSHRRGEATSLPPVRAGAPGRAASCLPKASPHISPHLPTSPHISPGAAGCAASRCTCSRR